MRCRTRLVAFGSESQIGIRTSRIAGSSIFNREVADFEKGVGRQGRKPLVLVLGVLPSLFVLLMHEFCRITEGRDSLPFLLSLRDRGDSLRDLLAHDEG